MFLQQNRSVFEVFQMEDQVHFCNKIKLTNQFSQDISLYTIVEIIEIEIGAQVLQPGRTPFPLFRHGTGMYLKQKMEIK